MKNEGWYFEDLRTFKRVDNPVPEPLPEEVVIEVGYVGICGSDLHAYTGEHPLVSPGKILGHEFTGRITKIGDEVKDLKIGDNVVVEPSISCGTCYNCTHGRYNICNELKVIGCVGHDGAFQHFVSVPAQKVYTLGEFSMKLATLTEPFAVGVHGVRRSSFKPGNEVLVIGAGPIGLFTAIFLHFSGAKKLVIIDLIDERLRFARDLIPGAITIKPEEFRKDMFTFEGPDLIFECVGTDATMNTAIESARKGTEILLVGVPPAISNVKMIYVQDRELKITGSLMYVKEDFLVAMDLLEKGMVDFDKIVTGVYAFDELPEAFEYTLSNKAKCIKTLIRVGNFVD